MKNKSQIILKNDVVVIMHHNWGNLEIPIAEWIQNGPGERERLKPVAIKDVKINKILPLRKLPVRYRNNYLSRFLIKTGLIEDPWGKLKLL